MIYQQATHALLSISPSTLLTSENFILAARSMKFFELHHKATRATAGLPIAEALSIYDIIFRQYAIHSGVQLDT